MGAGFLKNSSSPKFIRINKIFDDTEELHFQNVKMVCMWLYIFLSPRISEII